MFKLRVRLARRITQHIRYIQSYALALRDITPFGRNVVYAGNVMRNRGEKMKGVFYEP